MNFIKKNKYTSIVILIFVLLAVLGAFIIKIFFSSGNLATYGDRLEDIENYKIDSEQSNKLKKELKALDNVTDVSYDLKGKIVNVLITVSKDTKVADAKKLADSVLTYFEDDQIKYYDYQVFISSEDETNKSYPIIGYKGSSEKVFSFTADR